MEKKSRINESSGRGQIQHYGDVQYIYTICGTPIFESDDYGFARRQIGIELCPECKKKREKGDKNWPCARYFIADTVRGEPDL